MSTALSDTPARVNVRVKKRWGYYYVLARNGERWKVINRAVTRNKALEFIEDYHTNKDIQWSTDVKIRARWTCEAPGCGEGIGGDKALLEAHHIEPVAVCPQKRHDLDNGKCLCIFHHAMAHTGQVRLMILARLGLVLYGRLYPHKKAKIQRMAG